MAAAAFSGSAIGDGAQARSRAAASPVVVELYTAQGCQACPEANRLVGALAARKDVIALTFSVDYFDYLGWKDTFAAPAFAERQRAYVARLKVREIYTPEVVIDGRAEAPGAEPERIDALIAKAVKDHVAASPQPRIALQRRGARVSVGDGDAMGRSAEVWLIRYDPRERMVRVRGDDRKSKPVAHYNVVCEMVRLGAWRGRARSYPVAAPAAPGLKSLLLVQGIKGGPVLAARAL